MAGCCWVLSGANHDIESKKEGAYLGPCPLPSNFHLRIFEIANVQPGLSASKAWAWIRSASSSMLQTFFHFCKMKHTHTHTQNTRTPSAALFLLCSLVKRVAWGGKFFWSNKQQKVLLVPDLKDRALSANPVQREADRESGVRLELLLKQQYSQPRLLNRLPLISRSQISSGGNALHSYSIIYNIRQLHFFINASHSLQSPETYCIKRIVIRIRKGNAAITAFIKVKHITCLSSSFSCGNARFIQPDRQPYSEAACLQFYTDTPCYFRYFSEEHTV